MDRSDNRRACSTRKARQLERVATLIVGVVEQRIYPKVATAGRRPQLVRGSPGLRRGELNFCQLSSSQEITLEAASPGKRQYLA